MQIETERGLDSVTACSNPKVSLPNQRFTLVDHLQYVHFSVSVPETWPLISIAALREKL